MRNARTHLIVAILCGSTLAGAAQQAPVQTPLALIKDVVYNEKVDHERHGYFEYRVEKKTPLQTVTAREVETKCGRLNRVLSTNGVPLTAQQQLAEDERLARLLNDRHQQQQLKKDYEGDEQRIGTMMAMMPTAFLFDYDGMDGSDVRLKFRPNPAFRPPTYETRVFHAMSGTVWVNARMKRLSRLRGSLTEDVEFGYGLLGRVDKGGTFEMVRAQVTPQSWKTTLLDVHVNGHVILLKSMGKNQKEFRTDFRQVDANLSLAGARALLEKGTDPGEERAASSVRPGNAEGR